MKTFVIEMQTNADGTTGVLPYGYDAVADAEEKFGLVYAAAAKSSVLVHTVMIVNARGAHLHPPASFTHPVTPEPEQPEQGE